MSLFPRGSEWRKWDLHFHTPASFDYDDLSVTNQEIIDALIANGISLVAVTDHHIIDEERIKELRKIAAGRVTILPGIELRAELGGSEAVHFIGIFSDKADIRSIWIKLQGKCGLAPDDIKAKGDQKVYCDFAETAKCIHELGGIVTVHAGSKSNTIEKITNSLPHKMALKTDLAIGTVDIYELGDEKDQAGYKDIVFPHIGKQLPLVMCSDNHNARNYRFKQSCWVKADPTFEGLCQAINEATDRFFIGDIPDKVRAVSRSSNAYLDRLTVQKTDPSLSEPWFDLDIELNTDLIAIIGNKGSGKSALADIIGLVGRSMNEEYFSFLKADRFRKLPINPARSFAATLFWKDGRTEKKSLDQGIAPMDIEQVKYLPQQFIEKVCNDLGDGFEAEVNRMVYSYLPEEEKLGKKSFNELVSYLCANIDDRIRNLQAQLSETNAGIIALEKQATVDHKGQCANRLRLKIKEWKAHLRGRPKEVKPPKSDPGIQSQIEQWSAAVKTFEEEISKAQESLNQVTLQLSTAEQVTTKLKDFEVSFIELSTSLNTQLKTVGLQVELGLELKYDVSKLDAIIHDLRQRKISLNALLDKNTETQTDVSLFRKIRLVQEKQKGLQKDLTSEHQKYQTYLDDIRVWDQKKRTLIEGERGSESLRSLIKELRYLSGPLQQEIEQQYATRMQFVLEIYNLKTQKVKKYQGIYKPVLDRINDMHETERVKSRTGILEEERLQFTVPITLERGFLDAFLSHVNQAVAGRFRGLKEGRQNLSELVQQYDFQKEEDLIVFLQEIYSEITSNMSKADNLLKERLKFYNFLFGLEYLKIEYKLSLGKTPLEQLSPGEKGALLLIFYLVLDRSNVPLIIDQPEDNLDNHSVYRRLVPFIKDAKERRQVIIVTHNPNLAVACDAEQIIYSEMNKGDYQITYISGGIENPTINRHIVNVLEGTMPAFTLRRIKYFE